jgi:predicted membrane metal-binding protein
MFLMKKPKMYGAFERTSDGRWRWTGAKEEAVKNVYIGMIVNIIACPLIPMLLIPFGNVALLALFALILGMPLIAVTVYWLTLEYYTS